MIQAPRSLELMLKMSKRVGCWRTCGSWDLRRPDVGGHSNIDDEDDNTAILRARGARSTKASIDECSASSHMLIDGSVTGLVPRVEMRQLQAMASLRHFPHAAKLHKPQQMTPSLFTGKRIKGAQHCLGLGISFSRNSTHLHIVSLSSMLIGFLLSF